MGEWVRFTDLPTAVSVFAFAYHINCPSFGGELKRRHAPRWPVVAPEPCGRGKKLRG